MATECLCPYCREIIPLEDVNVATDIALCRACGRTSAFSMTCAEGDLANTSLDNPPRTIRVEEGFGGETTIVYHRLSPMLFFLVPFMALWSGASMIGIYGTQIKNGKFDLEQSLFGLPFAIGTVILLSVIAYLAFGRWAVTLNRGQGTVVVGVGPFVWTRTFSYNQTTIVSLKMTKVSVNDQPQAGVLVRTDDQDFLFGALIPEDAKRFIAAAILREVGKQFP
jgi:hypothetical protein